MSTLTAGQIAGQAFSRLSDVVAGMIARGQSPLIALMRFNRESKFILLQSYISGNRAQAEREYKRVTREMAKRGLELPPVEGAQVNIHIRELEDGSFRLDWFYPVSRSTVKEWNRNPPAPVAA